MSYVTPEYLKTQFQNYSTLIAPKFGHKVRENENNTASIYKLDILDYKDDLVFTTKNLAGGDGSGMNIVDKYSNLPTDLTDTDIAYVRTGETVGTTEYPLGFYIFDKVALAWEYADIVPIATSDDDIDFETELV